MIWVEGDFDSKSTWKQKKKIKTEKLSSSDEKKVKKKSLNNVYAQRDIY